MRRLLLAGLAALALAVAPASAFAATGIVRTGVSLPPGPNLFGEQIEASVDVLLNTKLVDPRILQVQTRFAPYQPVETASRTVTVEGSVADVHYGYVLACYSLLCTTGSKMERKIQFEPVQLRYRDRSGHALSSTVVWPSIREISRVGNEQPRPLTASEARAQLLLNPLLAYPASVVAPRSEYRLDPRVLALALVAAALAVLVVAGIIVRPVLVRVRRRESVLPELSPLERAMKAVEDASRRQAGGAEHRESLALLARELRRAKLSDLVRSARKLAWSEQAPSAEASHSLLAEVRDAAGGAS